MKKLKKTLLVILLISLASLVLSGFSIYVWWKSDQNGQPISLNYLVEASSEEQYRIYVLVDSQTVIADEFVGNKLYPVFVQPGDQIEVHGYSTVAFTVTLESPHHPVETETGTTVDISYSVPD